MRWFVLVSAAFAMVAFGLGVGLAETTTTGPSQQKLAAAEQSYTAARAELEAGAGTAEAVYRWSLRWLESGLQAGGGPKELGRAHLDRMTALEKLIASRVEQGMARASEQSAAAYYRLEAQIGIMAGK